MKVQASLSVFLREQVLTNLGVCMNVNWMHIRGPYHVTSVFMKEKVFIILEMFMKGQSLLHLRMCLKKQVLINQWVLMKDIF